MKKYIVVIGMVFAVHMAGAQVAPSVVKPGAANAASKANPAKPGNAAKTSAKVRKNAISGVVRDSRKRPVARVQMHVYLADTALIASGYTLADGRYETNSMPPGVYTVKVVNPNWKHRIYVTGVPVKMRQTTPLDISLDEPEEDNSVPYTDVMPAAKKDK